MTPELAAAHERLTQALADVMVLTGHCEADDPYVPLRHITVVYSRNMTLADRHQSAYTMVMKDNGDDMPTHEVQGLAKRMWDWANDDGNTVD